MASLKGVYQSNNNEEIKIIIEREYKKKNTVDFFYFMCDVTGGGTISNEDLKLYWTKIK